VDDENERIDGGAKNAPTGDPESGKQNTYECSQCGHRTKAAHQPEVCPKWGGDMIDLSVSRE
jgi:rubrerythrin